MERTRNGPLLTVLLLMIAAVLATSRVAEPRLTAGIGVRQPLPRQVGRWIGHELLYCSNEDCAEAFGADTFADAGAQVCPVCGSALDGMAPLERRLLPAGTDVLRSIYRAPDGSAFFVSVVIAGRDRLGLHRPENCLPGQGLSIRGSRILETPLADGAPPLRTRLLSVRRRIGGSDAAVFSHFAYWYVAPGRETPSQGRLYAWMAADRLFYARMDRWAYVAVAHDIDPSREDVSLDGLHEFLASLHPLIVAGSQAASVTSRVLWVMGTEATVVLPGRAADRLDAAVGIAQAVLSDAEQRMSLFRDNSELAAINRHAGMMPVKVSTLTFSTLALAHAMARQSDGAFDPTVAPLVRLWGFGGKALTELPDPARRIETLGRVGYRGLHLDAESKTAFLEREGMALDLGGVAKGTAVDAAAAALTAAGYDDFLVNLGGNLRCAGAPDGALSWRVGVRHPFDQSRILGVVQLQSPGSVATSGNYERYVVIEGERYTHVIDPRTGNPVRGMAGVTVLARDAGTADAMSTALFVTGIERAADILDGNGDLEALLVPDRMPLEIWVTPGFADRFEPLPEYRAAIRELL